MGSVLTQSPWHNQLHSLQDLLLAKHDITVHYGPFSGPYSHFLNIISHEHNRPGGSNSNLLSTSTHQLLTRLYQEHRDNYTLPEITVRRTQLLALQCNRIYVSPLDSRDKLYSIRQLLLDLTLPFPAISYSKPEKVIWDEFARTFIRSSRSLWLILANLPAHREPTLPSWLPDWRCTNLADAVTLTRNTELVLSVVNNCTPDSGVDLATLSSSKAGELALKAKPLSSILWTGRKFPLYENQSLTNTEALATFTNWFSWAHQIRQLDALEYIITSRNVDTSSAEPQSLFQVPELRTLFPDTSQAQGEGQQENDNLAFFQHLFSDLKASPESRDNTFWDQDDAPSKRLLHLLWQSLQGGVLFADSAGRLGVCWGMLPAEVRPGKHGQRVKYEVVLSPGSELPLVLGPEVSPAEGAPSTARYKLLAPAYVHEVMGGEAWKEGGDGDLETFVLC
jgi:hypothetical protein